MGLINLIYAVPKHAEVCSIDYIENVADNSMIKQTTTFEWLVEYKWRFWSFRDSINEVDGIFSSKVIILPNNRENCLEIQRPNLLRQ